MSLKSLAAKILSKKTGILLNNWYNNAISLQKNVFKNLIHNAKYTQFGQEHNFNKIKSYEDFKKQVPIRDYEDFKIYIDKIIENKPNILWKDKPLYFAKTSGTTSGVKYIPISKESINNHINTAKLALLSYIYYTGNSSFVDGKMIFLQGSPILSKKGTIATGRLSGIVAHHVPKYLQKNRMPSWETNCIEDWEEKIKNIVKETIKEDMRLISGIPPWVQMYFDELIKTSKKKNIIEIFPNLSLFVYGGVNFEPYKKKFEETIGKKFDYKQNLGSIETYPASEGFIAFQDNPNEKGLLLVVNSGIFFEFIPADEFFNKNKKRIWLKDVEIGKNYVVIINSNAGLWGYNLGDTVKFVSKNPYRIIVTGRIKHFTSAFGEHVIAEEVEKSLKFALDNDKKAKVIEFHVVPKIIPAPNDKIQLPYHQWFIEFDSYPEDIKKFAFNIDLNLQKLNPYYKDLIKGKILQPLKITILKKGAFNEYMKSIGKLGGQNKVPRLSNDREIANKLEKYILS